MSTNDVPSANRLQYEKWRRLSANWTDTGPPSTPSTHDLEAFRQLMMGTHGPGVILGATRSLRQLMRDHWSADTWYCVDFCREMYESQGQGLTHDARELWVEADWLDMPNLAGIEAGLVLGDKILDNVQRESWPGLVDSLRGIVASDTVIAFHVAFVPEEYTSKTFESCIAEAAAAWEAKVKPDSQILAELWEDLLGVSAFHGGAPNGRLTVGVYADELHELAEGDWKTPREICQAFLRLYGADITDYWTHYDERSLNELIAVGLVEHTRIYSRDYSTATSSPIIGFALR